MPEGDTIHRLARRIAGRIAGQTLTRLWLRDRGEAPNHVGAPIVAVEAVGKHLLVGIGEHHVLHTHLGMPGRVREVRGNVHATWDTSAIVAGIDAAFVWRSAPIAALHRRDDPAFVRAMQHIGPDLLAPECDLDDIVTRAYAGRGQRLVAELLLDQSIAAGIGNLFKSELMFAGGFHPHRRLDTVDRADLHRCYALARAMLQRSVRDGIRDTVSIVDPAQRRSFGEQLWVYDRAGGPCHRCKATIERIIVGEPRRLSYFCPRCQDRL